MLSWTRGLGSDLGRLLGQADGSTTSLTGHIFNVTRDVLMKGREKVDENCRVCYGRTPVESEKPFKFYKLRKQSLPGKWKNLKKEYNP
uniref:Uncharacterized protein n=2 Tax=Canis lupus familiaris TaxID=9615 RepID=A0A8C0SYS2_CANLF